LDLNSNKWMGMSVTRREPRIPYQAVQLTGVCNE
jgi:hypothetical protein